MPNTYTLIEKVVIGANGAVSFTFSNIPQSYTDLKIVYSSRTLWGQYFGGDSITFNGGGISGKRIICVNGSISTSNNFTIDGNGDNATTNVFGNGEIYITNYASSSQNKSVSVDVVGENNNGTAGIIMTLAAGIYSSTSPITSITISAPNGNYYANSTFYLYGINNISASPSSAPQASGGDVIANDGTYWYHAFKSSGTFTPYKSLNADLLVVAGGGSGGGTSCCGIWNGGGGAGGVVYLPSQSLTANVIYPALVGVGGGIPVAGGHPNGNAGGNSQFGTFTVAIGGGYGGGIETAGGAGGSGGGGGGYSTGNAGGAGTAGQGNNGGSGGGGGGGGAGGAGANGSNTANGAAGGAGTNAYSSWLSATGLGVSGYIAGGGGGAASSGGTAGQGGSGGGGNSGTFQANGVSAVANTGSGGGAAGQSQGPNTVGGAGGSGLIIVRYKI